MSPRKYTDDQLAAAVRSSPNMHQVLIALGLAPRVAGAGVRGRSAHGYLGQGDQLGPPPARCCDGHSGTPIWWMDLGPHPCRNGNPNSENRQSRIRQNLATRESLLRNEDWGLATPVHQSGLRKVGASQKPLPVQRPRFGKTSDEAPTYAEALFWENLNSLLFEICSFVGACAKDRPLNVA